MKKHFLFLLILTLVLSGCTKKRTEVVKKNYDTENVMVKEILCEIDMRLKYPDLGRFWFMEPNNPKSDSAITLLNRMKRNIIGNRNDKFFDYSDSIYHDWVPREFLKDSFNFVIFKLEINEKKNEAFTVIEYSKDSSWRVCHLLKKENKSWFLNAFQFWKEGRNWP